MNDFAKAFANLADASQDSQSTKPDFADEADLIKKSYELGKYLGIISNTDFTTYTTTGNILKQFSQKSLYDIRAKPKKLTSILGQHLENIAYENNRAFFVDWKWTVEEIVDAYKSIIPSLMIKLISQDSDVENEIIQGTFDTNQGTIHKTFKLDSIEPVIDFLNDLLENQGIDEKMYMIDHISDSHHFICLKSNVLYVATRNEFIDISP